MLESESGVIDCLSLLLPSAWPLDLTLECAEVQLKQACEYFRVNYCREMKQDCRDMKDTRDVHVVGPYLLQLMNVISTLPVSTAECERGFSRMNLIYFVLRTEQPLQ